jgi:hypothetical protein
MSDKSINWTDTRCTAASTNYPIASANWPGVPTRGWRALSSAWLRSSAAVPNRKLSLSGSVRSALSVIVPRDDRAASHIPAFSAAARGIRQHLGMPRAPPIPLQRRSHPMKMRLRSSARPSEGHGHGHHSRALGATTVSEATGTDAMTLEVAPVTSPPRAP